jgi:hypothetical protein
MNYDANNKLFQLAVQLVNHSNRHIFLTGKAGTGKTTFLKYIRENCPKQIAVVAPTGVAAINAGGVTIHSFFQLPISPFIPEAKGFNNNNETVNRHDLPGRLRLTGEKKKVMQELELLIIDEISMVRCDTLDAIDTVLRHVRRRHNEPFGGVQMLFIGDMYQLPPVVPDEEWKLLSQFYDSPYFFDSRVLKEQLPVFIEFNKIYRQSEEQFISLLNQVRNNELDEEGFSVLEKRFQPLFRNRSKEGYIILTTHNYKADTINSEELQKLPGKLFSYQAEIIDDFPEKSYPADEWLQLKPGAQVMFIKNDPDKSKRYFNGKIGIVTRLDEKEIVVQCKGDSEEIEVKKETWQNIRYTINKSTGRLEEKVLGSFTQYPLRLAWAITIHKSQGLTFERAVIDAGEAFAAGQVYVALSRCTNLDGLILKSRIRTESLRSDQRIVDFSRHNMGPDRLKQELEEASKNYQQDILHSLFDFTIIIDNCKALKEYLLENRNSFNTEPFSWLEELSETISGLQQTAEKFQQQMFVLFNEAVPPESNTILQERIKAGASYFTKQLEIVIERVEQSPAVTDSRQQAKEFNEIVKEIFIQIVFKKHLLGGVNGSFNIEAYYRRKNTFVVPVVHINAYAGAGNNTKTESPYPELYRQLRQIRDDICVQKDLPIYRVAGSKTLEEMTCYLPQTLDDLQKITGFGKSKAETYGQKFVEVIQHYCRKHNLTSRIAEKRPKHQRKSVSNRVTDTKAESFRLYKEGKSIKEIATQRNLTPQTIEGHLAFYVRSGKIDIRALITGDKLLIIENALKDFKGGSITPIKESLGHDISFGDIRLVIASLQFKSSHTSITSD